MLLKHRPALRKLPSRLRVSEEHVYRRGRDRLSVKAVVKDCGNFVLPAADVKNASAGKNKNDLFIKFYKLVQKGSLSFRKLYIVSVIAFGFVAVPKSRKNNGPAI